MLVYVRISCTFRGNKPSFKKTPLLDTKQFHHCFKGSLMWCPTSENYTWKDDKILRPNAHPMKTCHTSLMLKVYRIPWRCLKNWCFAKTIPTIVPPSSPSLPGTNLCICLILWIRPLSLMFSVRWSLPPFSKYRLRSNGAIIWFCFWFR